MSRDLTHLPGINEPTRTSLAEDQRSEPRRPAEGAVVIQFGEPRREVRGHLVDISASGFRIAHEFSTLETGQVVQFSHPEADGKAMVIWNRIAGEAVETGFMLIKN